VSDGEKTKIGRLTFSADCQLLFQLGEQLVTRRSVALAELVKNAYDADATKVVVELDGVTEPGGTITIEDDGGGMNLETIRNAWMRIATTEKTEHPHSGRFSRPRTGSKGIGRFACRRLADKLEIESIAYRDQSSRVKESVRVIFDWAKFIPGEEISSIPVVYHLAPASRDAPTGVTLTLSGCRETWGRDDIREVRRDLLNLQPPFPLVRTSRGRRRDAEDQDPGFSVRLVAAEFPGEGGSFTSQVRKAAWGRLDGQVDSKGSAVFRYRIRDGQPESWSPPDSVFPATGPFRFRIYHFVYDKEHLKGTGQQLVPMRELGRRFGGVRVYLDTFRVFPYGNDTDDWLNLDFDKGRRLTGMPDSIAGLAEDLVRPMLDLPGNNNLFGAVFVSRDTNPDLQPTASREGFVAHPASDQVHDAVRLAIDWMTVQYARNEQPRRAEKTRLREASDPVERIRDARDTIAELGEEVPRESRTQMVQALDLAIEAAERQQVEQISELSLLRVLASTGTMIVVFNHELRAMLGGLRGVYTDLAESAASLPARYRSQYDDIHRDLGDWVQSAEHQGELIGLLLGAESRRRRRRLVLRRLVSEMELPFSRYMREQGITFVNEAPDALRTPPMFECEIQSVLLNLLTNALKAVRTTEEKRVGVIATQKPSAVEMLFVDTGIGIARDRWETAFEPFDTDSEPDIILGTGTGLGLKIVRDLVEVYGGSVGFTDPPAGWRTCVRIAFAKEGGR
jgi:signal transduction histidine kinase